MPQQSLYFVREAAASDAPTIAEFNRQLAWESEIKRLDPLQLQRGVAAALQNPADARYFLAYAEAGAPLGQVMITYEWSDWRNGRFWWIQSVFVRPEFRRRGVFRALYEHVERLARATPDVCGLRLYVERANGTAQATYERLGFAPSGHLLFERDWS